MIGRFSALPGPVKVAVVTLAVVVVVAALLLFYDWLGTSLLDSGGTVG